ncbi:MAG: deoxyribonuclease IV [Dehalococcoidia bacterium]|jgi:deoxyribonuclease-4|nr:deoxyribonuclease IV [Dehalococcoidia bacterium]
MADTSPDTQIGAFVSSSGGIFNAIERAEAIEAEALMTFGSNNRTWRKTQHKPEVIERFREAHAASTVGEVWLHNIYLANLATDDPALLERSTDCVVNGLTVADAIAADGVILHTGSHQGRGFETMFEQVVKALTGILDDSPGDAVLALENAAGQGGVIGSQFSELGAILKAVDSPRLQVCLDTCHAFAAGYDLADKQAIEEVLDEFDREIGLDHLAVLHANDSMMELGGRRDRHDNIGDGHIGTDGFHVMMEQPALRGRAWLLEVPGIDGDGPDLENVNRLKKIRDASPG